MTINQRMHLLMIQYHIINIKELLARDFLTSYSFRQTLAEIRHHSDELKLTLTNS